MFPPEQPSQPESVVLCFQSSVTLLDPAVGCRLVPSCLWADGEGWGLQVKRWVRVGSAGPPTHSPRDCRLSPLHFPRTVFVPPVQLCSHCKEPRAGAGDLQVPTYPEVAVQVVQVQVGHRTITSHF